MGEPTSSGSRSSRFVRALSLTYVSIALTTAVGLWLTPFMITHLGQRQYGLWLVIGTTLGYLGLLDLGVVGLLPREVATASGQDNSRERIREQIGCTARIVFLQLPLVALAALAVWLVMPAR